MVAAALWEEIQAATYYRLLGVLAVANPLLVLLQPALRRLRGGPALPAAPAEPAVFAFRCTLDRPAALAPGSGLAPGPEGQPWVDCRLTGEDFAAALAAAVRCLEAAGARVLRVERRDG